MFGTLHKCLDASRDLWRILLLCFRLWRIYMIQTLKNKRDLYMNVSLKKTKAYGDLYKIMHFYDKNGAFSHND
uniref:Uncharacterized protein n=1 Tax=Lepeophtheirus salmonis TaxID=72036 RepID=A0A0K2V1G6_LEPSM